MQGMKLVEGVRRKSCDPPSAHVHRCIPLYLLPGAACPYPASQSYAILESPGRAVKLGTSFDSFPRFDSPRLKNSGLAHVGQHRQHQWALMLATFEHDKRHQRIKALGVCRMR